MWVKEKGKVFIVRCIDKLQQFVIPIQYITLSDGNKIEMYKLGISKERDYLILTPILEREQTSKNTTILKVDEIGRIVIPEEIVGEYDVLALKIECLQNHVLHLYPHALSCVFCGEHGNNYVLYDYKSRIVCAHCIGNLFRRTTNLRKMILNISFLIRLKRSNRKLEKLPIRKRLINTKIETHDD